jgi:hypothetical protein
MRPHQGGTAISHLLRRSEVTYLACRGQGSPHGRQTTMAYVSTHSHSILDSIAAGLRALGHFGMLMITAEPRVRAIEQLLRTSDEELAARGTTRDAELNHILGAGAAL